MYKLYLILKMRSLKKPFKTNHIIGYDDFKNHKKRERIMTTKEFIENQNRDANESSAEMTAQYETAGYELTDEELAAVTGGAFGVVI